MQSKITFKIRQAIQLVCVIALLTLSFGKTMAQGSLTTSYTPASGIAAPAGITFVIQNTNATARVLTNVDVYWQTFFTPGPATVKLWYTATALSGNTVPVATPAWTVIGNATVNVTGTGIIPTFSGLNFTIPANTQYRFAVESTNGINYGGGTTTPNNFTADGLVLKTGDAQIAAANVGYALNPPPNLVNNPRFFAGTITWIAGSACAGTPAPGATVSSVTGSCPGVGFTLSATPVATGTSGITYQWQSSTTGTAGSYTNIPGATAATYTTTQAVATYYQVIETCTSAGGGSATSTPLLVPLATACYCTASGLSNNGGPAGITNVTFESINQASTTAAPYENHLNDTATLVRGATYPISVTVPLAYIDLRIHVWIDWNSDGDWVDAGEDVFTSPAPNAVTVITGNITVPATATLGLTRMRIRYDAYDTPGANSTPCGTSDFGQVEDYTIKIVPCIPAVFTSQPSDASAVCSGSATFSVTATGSFPVYQWEYRTTPTGIWLNVPNAAPYSGANTNTLTINPVTQAMSGYQYRAILSGTCSGATPSTAATLTVTQIIATVTPATATICTGTTQQITLNNIDAAVPGSVTVNSATLNLNVPDNNAAGVNTSLTVPALPAGAIVTGVRVKLNVTSTWVGDLNVNLKAPNNQILNLDQNLSTTNGNATGGGSFVNTVIGSAYTTPLHTAASPDNTHTGNYKADAGTTTVAGITPNITGFIPTTNSWSALYTPSTTGVWTIAMADIFPGGDVTTFQNWSITIDYIAGTPSQGVWTGPAGTIFTNAGGTIPYTGTPANSVYVTPANGVSTYSVNFTSPTGCVSTTATSVITVNTVVTGAPLVANVAACANTNAVFSITGITGGTGLTYQWQVSTPSVPAFTNITGANSSTLTVSGVTAAQNGNQYRVIVGSGGCAPTLTSTAGTLTVNPTPVVTISAAPVVNIFPGLTSTLTAAVSSATAPIAYQWFLNGSAVTGATANMYTVAIDGEGRYTVRVTDANGCIAAAGTSTPASITIGDSVSTILFIYPSPNSGRFQVRYYNDINNGGTAPAVVNVYDEKGARVFTSRYVLGAGYNAMNVDLGTHGKGLYRVELLDLNENRIKTGSVMVF